MKKIIFKIIPVITFSLLWSCTQDLDTEGISKVTYYNEIELVGSENFIVDQGTAYVDPGVVAYEGETEVTDQVVIKESIDINTPGYYPVSYYIENVDGFGKTIVRNVYVLPADRSKSDVFAGTYTGEVSNGTFTDATIITHLGDGLYYADDFIGARYRIGTGYGPAYMIPAYFYVTGDESTYEALLTDSPWGPWEVVNPTLTGTTFSHNLQQGTFSTPVKLIKQ
ncbi:immunoglobulin-like domain-containing protein [Wenyingzhuangia sp. IMCC45467]